MIIWLSIGAVLIIFSIISFNIGIKNESVGWCTLSLVSFSTALAIIFALIIVRCDYNRFVYMHEMKRDYINELAKEESDNTQMLYEVVNVTELNENLFDIKTRVMMYGPFSFYPESVLDIEPIKVP